MSVIRANCCLASLFLVACDVAPIENRIDATVRDGAVIDAGSTVDLSSEAVFCQTPPPVTFCLFTCDVNTPPVEMVHCDNGEWVCPPGGSFDQRMCPETSCAVAHMACCNETTGAVAFNSECGPDGQRAPCPAGAHSSNPSICIPDALAIDDCLVLDNQPCTEPGTMCRSQTGLTVRCTCRADGVPSPVWQCGVSIGG